MNKIHSLDHYYVVWIVVTSGFDFKTSSASTYKVKKSTITKYKTF